MSCFLVGVLSKQGVWCVWVGKMHKILQQGLNPEQANGGRADPEETPVKAAKGVWLAALVSEGDLGPSVPNSPLRVGFLNVELQSKELPAPRGKRGTSHFHFELSKLLHIHGTETSKGIGCEMQPSTTRPHKPLGEHPGRPEHTGAAGWRLGGGGASSRALQRCAETQLCEWSGFLKVLA